MFFRLALRNIRKNSNRSLLAICGMIVAAAILTGGGAFAQLYPERGYFGYRQGAGGDILVFSSAITFDEQRIDDRSAGWRLDRSAGELARMTTYNADPRAMLVPSGAPAEPFRLDALPPAVSGGDYEVYPLLDLPVVVKYADAVSGAPRERLASLRGRMVSLDLDRYAMADSVTSGRYLRPTDGGNNVAVVNAPAMNAMMLRSAATSIIGLGAGQDVTVSVPAISGIRDGQVIYDYSRVKEYPFATVGAVALPTRIESLRDENGQLVYAGDGKTIQVQMYWDRPEVYIPRETWERIYSEVSGGLPIYTGRLGVVVRDVSRVKDVTATLGGSLPGTAIAVADLVAAQQAHGNQLVMPRNVTLLLNILAYLISGLLMAANMHVLVSQRQTEIGVLKAIGVGARDIFTLTLLETLGFAIVGGFAGFAAVTALLWLVGYSASGVTAAAAMTLTLRSLLRVMGFTLGAALLFGIAPALRATRATTVSVLRSE